jgi:hypothetical protein
MGPSLHAQFPLEVDTSPDQHVAGRICPGTLSECSVLEVRVHTTIGACRQIVHAIKDIKGIQPKFKIDTLCNGCHLLQGEVYIGVTRIAKLVGSFISFGSECRKNEVSARKNFAGTRG